MPLRPNPHDPQIIEGVPRVTDATVSALLGRDRRGALRTIIRANSIMLCRYAPLPEIDWRLANETTRIHGDYMLDEWQALTVTTLIESPKRSEAEKALKAMFGEARRKFHEAIAAPAGKENLPENVVHLAQKGA